MKKRIGVISPEIIKALKLPTPEDFSIYIGDSNINHMKAKHPHDFEKYGSHIADILTSPDYVGKNPKNDSIEYVKEFMINEDYVKVAVRITHRGKYFARSLYVLNTRRVKNFIKKGSLIPLDDLTNA